MKGSVLEMTFYHQIFSLLLFCELGIVKDIGSSSQSVKQLHMTVEDGNKQMK